MRHPHRSLRAFTLIELAIVLTIVGLLIGGIIGGQAIIKSAEINGTATEITQFTNAFGQFNNIYKAYPGDMSTATDYWGISNGSGSDNACYNSTAQGMTATCNGNGNRSIALTNPDTASTDCTEAYLLWQHLANAGLAQGSYSGRTANSVTTTCGNEAGVNTPLSRYARNSYFMFTYGSTSAYVYSVGPTLHRLFPGSGYHDVVLIFGGARKNTGALDYLPDYIFTPATLESLDRKLDDGAPTTGNMRAAGTTGGVNCYTGTAYNLSNTAELCAGTYAVTPLGM